MANRLMDWTPEMIGFMDEASSFSGYFKALAERIQEFLPKEGTVCDAGCGLGQLSVELSPYLEKVAGIDISSDAIAHFQKRLDERGLDNVLAIRGDMDTYVPDVPFSAMVFNSFGDIDQILSISKRCTRGPVVMIKRAYSHHRFSFSRIPIYTHNRDTAIMRLEELDIPYKEFSFSHEFGQRFRTLEEAKLFFSIYSRDEDRSVITEENVRAQLVETLDEEYRYYLPKTKECRIIVL